MMQGFLTLQVYCPVWLSSTCCTEYVLSLDFARGSWPLNHWYWSEDVHWVLWTLQWSFSTLPTSRSQSSGCVTMIGDCTAVYKGIFKWWTWRQQHQNVMTDITSDAVWGPDDWHHQWCSLVTRWLAFSSLCWYDTNKNGRANDIHWSGAGSVHKPYHFYFIFISTWSVHSSITWHQHKQMDNHICMWPDWPPVMVVSQWTWGY